MERNQQISVIVPIYNVSAHLDDCIKSIVSQTYDDLEIILVDDGSPDNCPAICDAWAEKDSRVKVIHKQNGGVSDARNAGMAIATGEWLIFVDADDVISKYLVEALYREHSGEDCLVVTEFIRFKENIPPDDTAPLVSTIVDNKSLIKARSGFFVCGALYSHELVNRLALRFDGSLRNLEDVVWNATYLRYVQSVKCINAPLYYYRVNPISITSHCVDQKWQVSSWLSARSAILNWFADKTLSATQKKEILKVYRHCQNNIYAECLTGNISFQQYHQLECSAAEKMPCNEELLSTAEKILKNYTPWLYYQSYLLLLRLKRRIQNCAGK